MISFAIPTPPLSPPPEEWTSNLLTSAAAEIWGLDVLTGVERFSGRAVCAAWREGGGGG